MHSFIGLLYILPAEFTIMVCGLLCPKQLITNSHSLPLLSPPHTLRLWARLTLDTTERWSWLVPPVCKNLPESVDCCKNGHAIINPPSKDFRTALLMMLVDGRGVTSRRKVLKRITVSFCFNGTIKIASPFSDLMFPEWAYVDRQHCHS